MRRCYWVHSAPITSCLMMPTETFFFPNMCADTDSRYISSLCFVLYFFFVFWGLLPDFSQSLPVPLSLRIPGVRSITAPMSGWSIGIDPLTHSGKIYTVQLVKTWGTARFLSFSSIYLICSLTAIKTRTADRLTGIHCLNQHWSMPHSFPTNVFSEKTDP